MALTVPTFTVNFNLDTESGTFGFFTITDTTDYAGEGVALSDVQGYLIIFFPDGSTTLATILPATSVVNTVRAIPKDSNLNFLEGTYGFQYTVFVAGAVQPGTYLNPRQDFEFCPELKPQSTIAPLLGAAPSISVETSCFCFLITANDLTDYGTPTTTSRVFSLYPPPSLGISPYTTSGATLTYNFQNSGTYQVQVNTLVTYVDGIFTITVRVKGSVFEPVNCDINLCGLVSCFNTYRSATLTKAGQFGGFANLSKSEYDLWMRIHGGMVAFDNNLKCGNGAEATTIYNELKTLLACDCNCSEDDAPRLLNPYCLGTGSNNSITVVTAGTGIDVSASVIGATTTYTVAIESAIITSITTNTTDITNLTTIVNNIIAGTSGNNYRLIENDTTVVTTDANTLEKTLIQETLSAGLLAADGDYLRLKALFLMFPNTDIKLCRLYFGAFVFTVQFPAVPGFYTLGELIVDIIRTGAATQKTNMWYNHTGIPGSSNVFVGTATETLSGAILVKMTGQNATAVASEIASQRLMVEYFKKA